MANDRFDLTTATAPHDCTGRLLAGLLLAGLAPLPLSTGLATDQGVGRKPRKRWCHTAGRSASYLDPAGIQCRTVKDAARVLDALKDPVRGYFDPRDIYTALRKG